MEAWKGEVINRIGKDVVIVRDNRLIRTYSSKEPAVQLDTENVVLGLLNDEVELGYERCCNLQGFPPFARKSDTRPVCYYIVSKRVVLAARQQNRSIEHLLVPHHRMEATPELLQKLGLRQDPHKPTPIFCQSLMPAWYWYDLRVCLRVPTLIE